MENEESKLEFTPEEIFKPENKIIQPELPPADKSEDEINFPKTPDSSIESHSHPADN